MNGCCLLSFIIIILIIGIWFFVYSLIAAFANNIDKSVGATDKEMVIKVLMRQCARWAVAARNDMNPMIAVMHANYAAGYLWALNDIVNSSDIEAVMDISYIDFKQEIVATQDYATKKMAYACPEYAPPASLLTRISGENIA